MVSVSHCDLYGFNHVCVQASFGGFTNPDTKEQVWGGEAGHTAVHTCGRFGSICLVALTSFAVVPKFVVWF